MLNATSRFVMFNKIMLIMIMTAMEVKSVATFPVILVKLAIPLFPTPNILSKWVEMRAFLATTLLGREWGDDGMNPKAIKKFSIGVESYVPIITCKGFFTQSQVLLSSIVAVGNV